MTGDQNLELFENLQKLRLFVKRRKWWLLAAVLLPAIASGVYFHLHADNWNRGALIKIKKLYFPSGKPPLLSLQDIEKIDFEKINLLIEENESYASFANHFKDNAVRNDAAREFYLQPQFSIEWTPEKLKREYLKSVFVFGKAGSQEWKRELNFIKNVFFQFNAREICQVILIDWLETLRRLFQEKRALIENIWLVSEKIALLHLEEKKTPRIPNRDFQLLLQADANSERYLDHAQQLAANKILLDEQQNSLQMNKRRVLVAHRIIHVLETINLDYLVKPSLPISLIEDFIKKEISGAESEELSQELLGLQVIFRQIQKTGFSAQVSPASIPRNPSFYLKYFAFYIVAASLFLLVVIFLDMLVRRND